MATLLGTEAIVIAVDGTKRGFLVKQDVSFWKGISFDMVTKIMEKWVEECEETLNTHALRDTDNYSVFWRFIKPEEIDDLTFVRNHEEIWEEEF